MTAENKPVIYPPTALEDVPYSLKGSEIVVALLLTVASNGVFWLADQAEALRRRIRRS